MRKKDERKIKEKRIKKISRYVVADWIEFRQINEDEYEVVYLLFEGNPDYENEVLEAVVVEFAKKLDGKTSPYDIDPELTKAQVDLFIEILDDLSIIRDKDYLAKNFLRINRTICRPNITPAVRIAGLILNTLLMVSFLPVLIFAVKKFFELGNSIIFYPDIVGVCVGLIMSAVFHELAHFFACVGYGGRAFEIGLFLQAVLPGAYVLMNTALIKKRFRRIQIYAAGTEADLLLIGICIILACGFESMKVFFLSMALEVVVSVFMNILFFNGTDGSAILGDLMGAEEIYSQAKTATKKYRWKKRLKNMGIHGKAILFVCYVYRVFQIISPLIIICSMAMLYVWIK